MSETYHFTEQRECRFYGGRWDGYTIKVIAAPIELIIAPDGSLHTNPAAGIPNQGPMMPGWTRYERVLVPEPVTSLPVRYVDPLQRKEGA